MVIENNHKFDAAVLPAELVNTALFLGHNQSGHNGFQRKYAAIKRIYYWKGMCKDILRYCKGCSQCANHWVEKRKFIEQSFKPGVQPMEFISMDLVGEFHPPSLKGNRYALTAVCMLTNFVFCIPLKNNSASEIITAWRNHIAFPFRVSRKLLTDNGTEFKNSLFAEVVKELGLERKIYSPPYRPQSNGVLEGFHKFLKASFAKHISRHKEWDDVAAMVTASYNYMPNQHSKEAPFFVMFGRDAVTNIRHITVPRYRYMGTEGLILDLEIMSNIYQCQIINLQLARHRALKLKVGDTQPLLKTDLAVGDLVLIRDHASKTFMPKYKVDFRIVRILGNKVEVKDNHGKLSFYHISDIKKTDMITKLICQLPDHDAFERRGRLSFDPARVKDLGWDVKDQEHKFDPSHVLDPPEEKQRTHPMQLRGKTVNKVEINLIDFSEPGDDSLISTKL